MSNEEILEQRWQKTDKTLEDYLRKFDRLSENSLDSLIELFDSLSITYQDLNKPISERETRRLDRKILKLKENGLYNDYLDLLIVSKRKMTYADLLEISIYIIYLEQQSKIEKYSKNIFEIVAEDIYNQAYDEIPKKYRPKRMSLTWEFIWSLLWVPTYNKHIQDYFSLLTLTCQQEAYKNLLIALQQNKLNEAILKDLLKKQMNRILCINDGKYSGIVSDTCRTLGNEVYTKPFKNKKLQVRFIAEMDEKTTKMCEGMDGMLFYVNDWNKFYRYSAVDKKDVYYTCNGLETGINLPPINNHFHWCRSTITYQLNIMRIK